MSVAVWLGLGVVAWLALGVAVAVPIGKALHRVEHRNGTANPADCSSWCVRERAAALYGTPRRGGRHHLPRRVRIDLGRKHR